MKEFFVVLFFSKMVLLTPAPVTLQGEIEITPAKAVSAINPGAGLHVDLSEFAPGVGIKTTGAKEATELLGSLIPERSVLASLVDENGQRVELTEMSFALENTKAWLVLRARSGVPLDTGFVHIKLESAVEIGPVRVYWKNFKQ